MLEKFFQVTSRRRVTWKAFSSMNDYDEARKTSYHEVRSHWIDIVDNYNQVTFYGKMYGKVQYRTPIPSQVPVKVNTVSIFWSLSLIISKILKFDHATTGIMIDQKKGEVQGQESCSLQQFEILPLLLSCRTNDQYFTWGILVDGPFVASGASIPNYKTEFV